MVNYIEVSNRQNDKCSMYLAQQVEDILAGFLSSHFQMLSTVQPLSVRSRLLVAAQTNFAHHNHPMNLQRSRNYFWGLSSIVDRFSTRHGQMQMKVLILTHYFLRLQPRKCGWSLDWDFACCINAIVQFLFSFPFLRLLSCLPLN